MLRITNLEWHEENVSHIARHGVGPEEAEEVCFETNPFIVKSRYNRYYALGQTENGRYLTIVFEYRGQSKAKIITARAMSESERRLYKRR